MTNFGWKEVTCSGCGATYTCTPSSDFYHKPDDEKRADNGFCLGCLLADSRKGD